MRKGASAVAGAWVLCLVALEVPLWSSPADGRLICSGLGVRVSCDACNRDASETCRKVRDCLDKIDACGDPELTGLVDALRTDPAPHYIQQRHVPACGTSLGKSGCTEDTCGQDPGPSAKLFRRSCGLNRKNILDLGGTTTYVADTYSGDEFCEVLVHELAHAFGKEHPGEIDLPPGRDGVPSEEVRAVRVQNRFNECRCRPPACCYRGCPLDGVLAECGTSTAAASLICSTDVLIRGTFGFRESEWNGLLEPNRLVQEEHHSREEAIAQWSDSLSGNVASERYSVGPPPPGSPGGCWVDGTVDQELSFGDSTVFYSIDHTNSFYSFCGVNIHDWSTFSAVDIFVRGTSGTAFSMSGSAVGSEELGSGHSFGYRTVILTGWGAIIHSIDHSGLGGSHSLGYSGQSGGVEIIVDGEVYSRAVHITVGGGLSFGYSNILLCPQIPWHTSTANVTVNLSVRPE